MSLVLHLQVHLIRISCKQQRFLDKTVICTPTHVMKSQMKDRFLLNNIWLKVARAKNRHFQGVKKNPCGCSLLISRIE